MMINFINEKVKNLNIKFILESATFEKKSKTLSLVLVYPDGKFLSAEIQQKVKFALAECLPEGVLNTEVKYKKNYYDEAIVAEIVLSTFRIELPIIRILENDINLLKEENKLVINIENQFISVLGTKDMAGILSSILKEQFYDDFNISFEYIPNRISEVKEDKIFKSDNGASDKYLVKLVSTEEYIGGEKIENDPRLIRTISSAEEGVIIAGKIKNLKENTTKPKLDKNGKERPEKKYYVFDICDYSGKIRCVYFPTKATLPKMDKLADDLEICVFGDVEEDAFNSGLTIRPKVINLCIFEKDFFEKEFSWSLPESYKYVKPEKYEVLSQDNLFENISEIENEYLLNNTFVVFDLETTGKSPVADKIIEIGAVKVVGGKMTETFGCLIDPEIHIPEDASKVNNIYDEDVKGAYKIEQVLPEFLKFCEGSIMVSYVIGFDFNFILNNANTLGYIVNNETLDAFVLAKERVKGVKNYKLTTVAKFLEINLENAHRATNDAVATAEVMIKLLKKN